MTTFPEPGTDLPPARAARPRRRTVASAIFLVIGGLVLMNAAVVSRQDATATGEHIFSLDDADIAVYQDGSRDAQALVPLHGLAGSAHWWDPLVAALSMSYRVIRIDVLGHGRSAKPADGDYSIPAQGRRVGKVLDRLGVRRAVVVGHSTGGSIATALAEQRDELVTALALINTGPDSNAFVSGGAAARLLTVPVVGQFLWQFRTDGLIRESMRSAFTRDIEIPRRLEFAAPHLG